MDAPSCFIGFIVGAIVAVIICALMVQYGFTTPLENERDMWRENWRAADARANAAEAKLANIHKESGPAS